MYNKLMDLGMGICFLSYYISIATSIQCELPLHPLAIHFEIVLYKHREGGNKQRLLCPIDSDVVKQMDLVTKEITCLRCISKKTGRDTWCKSDVVRYKMNKVCFALLKGFI